jgi:hypothetical protein
MLFYKAGTATGCSGGAALLASLLGVFALTAVLAKEEPASSTSPAFIADWIPTELATTDRGNILAEFDVARGGDLILVPVFLGGREFQFLVDTGATCCIVDIGLRSRLVETGKTVTVDGQGEFAVCRLPQSYIGKNKLPLAGEALCIDLASFRELSGHNIRGILGMDFLRRHVVHFDFDAGKLAFLRTCPVSSHDNSFTLSYSETEIPRLDLEVGQSQCVSFQIDTGSLIGECGVLARDVFDQLLADGQLASTGKTCGRLTVRGPVFSRAARLNRLRLGEFELANLGFAEGDFSKLSLAYLSRYIVTFDFQNDRMHLRKGQRFEQVCD